MTAEAIYFFLCREANQLRVTASIWSGVMTLGLLALVIMLSSFGSFFMRASASMCQARDILSSRSLFLRSVSPARMTLISRSVSRQNNS
ncbi:hypothetical protein M0654_11255 [Rhizobium sp. NTR19]|uniref:Uncharacterized protein n=1 Tax=Neorhizobium turbinariae TaxID=2937795 RepID=A0ABT0IRQ1_9HYPH|nr:hypothetical protein [Neorhizobium turbinariae]MCK8780563.1 hypothetical protein [Neorhizobium turbinariae]